MKRVIAFLLTVGILFTAVSALAEGNGDTTMKGLKIIASEDSYVVNVRDNKDTNYNRDRALEVRHVEGSGEQERKSFMKFDLSAMEGKKIGSARLYIKGKSIQDPCNIVVYGVNNDNWNEKEITWNNKPGEVGQNLGSFLYNTANVWNSVDVSEFVKAQTDGIVTFRLEAEETGDTFRNSFYSKEIVSNEPYLVIGSDVEVPEGPTYTFTDAAGSPTDMPVQGGGLNCSMSLISNDEAITEATMITAVYGIADNQLLAVDTDTKQLTAGTAAQYNCTLDNLPGGLDSMLIKTVVFTPGTGELSVLLTDYFLEGEENDYPVGKITVTAPELRSDITQNEIFIEAYAPGFTAVKFESLHQPDAENPAEEGYIKTIAENLIPNRYGFVKAKFPANDFPYGPISIKVTATAPGNSDSYYVQLYNTVGVKWNMGAESAPTPKHAQGMELAYVDDFNGPLSISKSGMGTTYSSHTPYGGDYGDATFEDYEGKYNPFDQRDEYFKISVTAPENYKKNNRYGLKYAGGLISTVHPDGTGKAWTHGYFECRMICPPGLGTWPAFWLLSQNRMDADRTYTAEVDIIEGYGYELNKPRQCYHRWSFVDGQSHTNLATKYDMTANGMTDTAQAFHTYAARVDEDFTYFYIDDVEVWKQPTYDSAQGPLFFMINLAMGPGGGGIVDLSDYGEAADMYVDYVRVYVPKQ